MNPRIGFALLISVSLHALAIAVSIAMPTAASKVAHSKNSSPIMAIEIISTAPSVPNVLSPLVGLGSDSTAKLDGAQEKTLLTEKTAEDSIEKAIAQSSIGDAANSKTKAFESSATGQQGKDLGLKSVLISALQFDPDFYPPDGGKLKVRIQIDEAGIPRSVTRISHSPKNLNIAYFLESILEARFIPAEKDGVLVANSIVVDIDLKLEENLLAQHFLKK